MSKIDVAFSPTQIEHVDPTDIQVRDTAIRDVNRNAEEYILLKADLERGNPITQPIVVAKATDRDSGDSYYELIDGRHRLEATLEVGINTIPAVIYPEDTPAVVRMGIQLRNNALRVKQTQQQEGKQYQRLLAMDRDLTTADIAKLVGQSENVVKDRLKLTEEYLKPEVVALVSEGKISARSAKELATAGRSLQSPDLIEAAKILPAEDLKKRIESERKALNSGEAPTPKVKEPKVFEAKYKSRDRSVVEAELASGTLAAAKFTNPAEQEAFLEGVRWAVSLDEDTVTAARDEFERKIQAAEEAKREKELAKLNKRRAELEGTPVEEPAVG